MEKVKSLYRGGYILLLGFLFMKLGGFFFRMITMRILPVSAYGEVALFLVLHNWFVLFATLSVTIGLAKFVSHDSSKKELYYVSSLAGSLLIAVFVSAALLLMTPWLSETLNLSQTVIHWAILSIPFAVVYNIGIFYFRGLYRMKSSVAADAIMTLIRIAALVGLLTAGLYYAPYLAFLLSFMVIDVYLLLKNRSGTRFGFGEISPAFRILLLYSIPIFISEFLRVFSTGVDRLMLSGFYSTVEAGIYDVAVAFCLGYVIIASSYSNALLPLSSSSQGDTRKRRSELFRALKASSAFFVLYTLIVMFAGQTVINLVNPLYMGIFGFLPLLTVAYMMIGFFTILSFYANSLGYQRHVVYAGAVFAFLSLVLNFYLIPKMMYMGAVSALLISSTASLAVMTMFILKVERWSRKREHS